MNYIAQHPQAQLRWSITTPRGITNPMLNMIRHGTPTDKPALLIAHGLYGSARNWGVIAKRLSNEREVIAVDMRNHGNSDWQDTHTYPDLAGDLAEVVEHIGAPMDILGHSMGGKASMLLALTRPDLVNTLVVADIAPVTYTHTQMPYVDAMQSVDLSRVEKRSDGAALLTPVVDDPALVPFFLQSLDVAGRRWRLNLDVLRQDMSAIIGFPEVSASFAGPTLFLTGGASDYVRPEHRDTIKQHFSKARFVSIPGAGHWLHAEKPREFEATVRAWLNRA